MEKVKGLTEYFLKKVKYTGVILGFSRCVTYIKSHRESQKTI